MGKATGKVQHGKLFRRFVSFLASGWNRTRVPDSSTDSVRTPSTGLPSPLQEDVGNVSGRLRKVGKGRVPRGVDEKVPTNVHTPDKAMSKKTSVTKEDVFANSIFEWVKTERQGDISSFFGFENREGINYVVFQDGTSVRESLIGDVVLMHADESQILGKEHFSAVSAKDANRIMAGLQEDGPPIVQNPPPKTSDNPVTAILDKAKKRQEKLPVTFSVKIPANDIYEVLSSNFDKVDELLVDSVIKQIEGKALRNAVKASLMQIYAKKKPASK